MFNSFLIIEVICIIILVWKQYTFSAMLKPESALVDNSVDDINHVDITTTLFSV